MHKLSASFVLGYHGCDETVAERLLKNKPFTKSENSYDWLGPGIYFWEANPDRAMVWAREVAARKKASGQAFKPSVVGAVIDLGFCLDLISANGIETVRQAHLGLVEATHSSKSEFPKNKGGDDLLFRHLDCAVIQYLHAAREEQNESSFDTVRAIFTEGKKLYDNAGFREKTHIQLCVAEHSMIKGVFRVPPEHFSEAYRSTKSSQTKQRSSRSKRRVAAR